MGEILFSTDLIPFKVFVKRTACLFSSKVGANPLKITSRFSTRTETQERFSFFKICYCMIWGQCVFLGKVNPSREQGTEIADFDQC